MTEIECPKCKHTWEDDELVHVDDVGEITLHSRIDKEDND